MKRGPDVFALTAGFCLTLTLNCWGAPPPQAEKLLPNNTLLLVTIPNVPETVQRFMNTSFGRMSRDAQLRPLFDHLYGSLADTITAVQENVGLSLPQFLALPQGELTFAMVAADEGQVAWVVMLYAGQEMPNLRTLIGKGSAALEQAGAKATDEDAGGVKLRVWDLPERQNQKICHFEKNDTLVVASNRNVAVRIAEVWNGRRDPTLTTNEAYTSIMRRCLADKSDTPHFALFFDPIGLIRAMASQNPAMRIGVAMLPALGLDGLLGLGGTITFDTPQYDVLVHAYVPLGQPRGGVLEVLSFKPADLEPEDWVPNDIAEYTTLRWDLDKGLKALTKVIDSIQGEGATSRFLGERLQKGTGMNFEQDVLPLLDGRLSIVTRVQPGSATLIPGRAIGLRLKDPERFAKSLERMVAERKEAFTEQGIGGKRYWQQTPRPPRPGAEPPPSTEERQTLTFGIIDDYAVLADRGSLYQKFVVTLSEKGTRLADALDYKIIAGKIKRQPGADKLVLFQFRRPEEGYRAMYNLAVGEQSRRQLRDQAARNPLFRAINSALEANPLPPFEVIQKYLAPRGSMIIDDGGGLYYFDFTLRRKTE